MPACMLNEDSSERFRSPRHFRTAWSFSWAFVCRGRRLWQEAVGFCNVIAALATVLLEGSSTTVRIGRGLLSDDLFQTLCILYM